MYKIDVFLSSIIFHSWKDSIILLQTTSNPMLLPLAEDFKIVSHCIESISSKTEASSITRRVPKDWWVEDLCELEVDLYKSIMSNIINRKVVSSEVIGEALKASANGRLPNWDVSKHHLIAETIVWLLPDEKVSVSCSFLLKLYKTAIFVDLGDMTKQELVRRIGRQLEEASVKDILVQPYKHIMGKLPYPNLALSKFVDLAELVSGIPRPTHDGLYRVIDMYVKLRTSATSGTSTPEMLKGTNKYLKHKTEDDSDAAATAEELKALRKELAALSLNNKDKVVMSKVKGLLKSKRSFIKLWASKMGVGENNSSSDSSESNGFAVPEEAKSTPSRN
ncbi:hypothetical protein K1719_005132 [Acacia pycnantha]|nr:hypothetical protein K1719_005132 [Acacia pycnantha]